MSVYVFAYSLNYYMNADNFKVHNYDTKINNNVILASLYTHVSS